MRLTVSLSHIIKLLVKIAKKLQIQTSGSGEDLHGWSWEVYRGRILKSIFKLLLPESEASQMIEAFTSHQ